MVPLPRPQGAPKSCTRILEYYKACLHTTKSTEHALRPRSIKTSIDNATALYIFLGILISLCIAAPLLRHLRGKQTKDVNGYIERAKTAAAELDGRVAELAALKQRHETLVHEQEQLQTLQRQQGNELRDARLQSQTLQEQIHDLEQSRRDIEDALRVTQMERDTALGEAREARQSHSATLETVRNLEREIQTKEEVFTSLLQRYNFVDQEYRQQGNELRDAGLYSQTLQEQIHDLEQSRRDIEDALRVTQRERDTALGEAREAQQSHSATLRTIRNLEREIQTKEEGLTSLLQRYNHVDQEYRLLMSGMTGNET